MPAASMLGCESVQSLLTANHHVRHRSTLCVLVESLHALNCRSAMHQELLLGSLAVFIVVDTAVD